VKIFKTKICGNFDTCLNFEIELKRNLDNKIKCPFYILDDIIYRRPLKSYEFPYKNNKINNIKYLKSKITMF
jgi:hypothetical protein